MPESRAVTALVPRVAAGTLLVLVVGTFASNNNLTGSGNKLIYACVLVLAVVITALSVRSDRLSRFDVPVAVVVAGGLIWGIWTIERPGLLASGYWEGFGSHVAIAACVLIAVSAVLLRPQHFSRPVRIVLAVALAVLCACDVLGAIRTIDYMPYVNNNINEINDMLGPAAGKVPELTYIPQYTALYGWLFLPFKSLLSPLAMVGAISIFLTALGFATVGIAVWIVKRVLAIKGYLLAVAIVVPITYVTSHQIGDFSSIASLFQELPIRLLSGFVILAIGLTDLVLLYRGTLRSGRVALIGFGCGLIAWNSQDFGVAATGVYGLMIVLGATHSVRWRAGGVWVAGLLAGVASYPLFLLAIGSPVNLSFVAAYIKLFGSGVGSAPMQVPGPVLVVMPIIVCGAAAGWGLMRSRRREGIPGDRVLDQAAIALTFVGTWSLLGLVYYVNRAYAAGQLQTMLLPCAVCVGALLAVAIHSDEVRANWLSTLELTRGRLSAKAKLIPLGALVCLCFSSVLLTPDPVLAMKTLVDPPPMSGFTTYDVPVIIAAVHTAQRYTEGKPGALTYLGESFNYVTLDTHVASNAALFPFPLSAIGAVTQIECRYLEAHHSRWMVLSLDGLKAFGSGACGIYQPVRVPGLTYGQLQEFR